MDRVHLSLDTDHWNEGSDLQDPALLGTE